MNQPSKQKRVLLIAYHYLQQEDTASNRTRGILQYLPEYGWDVTLITADNGIKNSHYPSNIIFVSSFKINCSNIFRPLWKRIHSPRKVEDETSLSTGNVKIYNIDFVLRTLLKLYVRFVNIKYCQIVVKAIISFAKTIYTYPDYGAGWYHFPLKSALREINRNSYQAILSTAAPITDHRIASKLKHATGLPWIADYRDLWAGNPYFHDGSWDKTKLYNLEKSYLLNADMLTVVSKGWENDLIQHHHKPVTTILNGFDPQIINSGMKLRKKFIITYAGALHRGKRDPTSLFQVIRELANEEKILLSDVQVDFYTSYCSDVQMLIGEYELTDCVFLRGLTSREEIINLERSSQILLLLTWNDPQDAAVYPAKVFEYLAAKRPILSIGYDGECALSALLSETQAGIHPLSYTELKQQVLTWYIEYKNNGEVQYRGDVEKVMMYSQYGMAKKFADVLDAVVT